jgi:hypothetical protein
MSYLRTVGLKTLAHAPNFTHGTCTYDCFHNFIILYVCTCLCKTVADLQILIILNGFMDFYSSLCSSYSVHQFQYNFEVLWAEIGSRHARATRRTWCCSLTAEILLTNPLSLVSMFTPLLGKTNPHFLQNILINNGSGEIVWGKISVMTMGSFHVFKIVTLTCVLHAKLITFLQHLIFHFLCADSLFLLGRQIWRACLLLGYTI